jgi:Cd2+/Zn2+-exporting ATPase
MQEPFASEKFHLTNLDCAACAAKLEHGLREVAGVAEAVVDFANLTLHIRAENIASVLEAAHRIEPDLILVPHGEFTAPNEAAAPKARHRIRRSMVLLLLSSILFLIVLLFEERFKQKGWFVQEALIVLTAYLLAGGNVLAAAWRTVRRGVLFDENVLMVIATGGALAIHAYAEAIGVMLFYKVGEMLQDTAVNRSRRSIRALLAAKPSRATLQTEAGLKHVSPEDVQVGDVIVVKPGEKIPLDGDILSGRSQLDTAALTGEPLPVKAEPGRQVMAGQINKTGTLTIKVSRLFRETSIARVMDLVENATARKAKTEKFITTFARYYTPAVVFVAAVIAVVPPLVTQDGFQTWIYRALVILVISCPCALVVSIPLGYFGGIGRASREGILVKGSNFIDVLAAVKTVVFDKTGTLTRGVFELKELVCLNGFSEKQVMEFAAAAEYQSNHPIAHSILSAFKHKGGRVDTTMIHDHKDIPGQGVSVRYGDRAICVGNDALLHLKEIDHDRCKFLNTVAHIAVDGRYAGFMTIGDEIRPESAKAVQDLRAEGVCHVAMLTGDNDCAAEAISGRLGLDGYHADLLPEDKVAIFDQIEKDHRRRPPKIAFVGDGINDAPAIARADVGIAMGGVGSDAAVETADVVLMEDSPLKIARAIAIAKQTRRIVWQNIVLAFVVKGFFIVFGVMGMATMWEAVFADMGTALLAVANATRLLHGRGIAPSADAAAAPLSETQAVMFTQK